MSLHPNDSIICRIDHHHIFLFQGVCENNTAPHVPSSDLLRRSGIVCADEGESSTNDGTSSEDEDESEE